MTPRISPEDALRVLEAARRLEEEAQTWREGFAVAKGDLYAWAPEHEWAHIRYMKLLISARALRSLAKRAGPQEPEYHI